MAGGAAPPGKLGGKGDPGGHALEGRLAGVFKRNPATAVGLGGVAVVVVFAMARRSAKSGGGSGAGSEAGTPSDQLQTYSPQGTGLYDSTATDLYNSIEPQLQALSQAIQTLSNRPPVAGPAGPRGPAGPPGKPAPKPKPKKHRKPKKPRRPVHHRGR
jgi:hypothetical protein